jgi:hypothetical protein
LVHLEWHLMAGTLRSEGGIRGVWPTTPDHRSKIFCAADARCVIVLAFADPLVAMTEANAERTGGT